MEGLVGRDDGRVRGEGKWIGGSCPSQQVHSQCTKAQTYGTRLVWNSFRSTLSEPSNRERGRDGRHDLGDQPVQVGERSEAMPRFLRQMS